MESQIKQLKLNATNIKNTLFNKNKELKKLRLQEKNLFQRQQIERKREQKEAFVESQKTSGGVLGRIGSRLLSGPMSLFDKIKEFFGTILLGILINNLPRIYAAIQKFLDENKWLVQTIKAVIKFTGNAIMGFIDVFNSAKDIIGDLGDTIGNIKKELDELAKYADTIVKETSILNDNIFNLDKEFKDEFKDVIKEDTIKSVKQTLSSNKISKKEFIKKATQYRRAKGSSGETREVSVPGIGTYQRVSRGGILGFLGIGTKEIAKNMSGEEISPREFDARYNIVAQSQSEIFDALKKEGVEGYSKGGTVRPSPSSSDGSFSGESGTARKARESTQTFSTFERNTEEQSGLLMVQNENNERFEEMIENFKTLRKLSQKKDDKTPPVTPPVTPPGTLPGTLPPPPPGAKGSIITFDSAQGRDASGEPGVDFSFADIYRNYSIFPGTVVEVGSYYGSGYGRHVTVRSKDSNGKEFDALYAHFGSFAVKEGDTVQAGDYLGSVGWDPVTDTKMSGAGNMTGPHTSVDFYEPNARPGIVTPAYAGRDKIINLILNSANKDVKSLAPLAPPVSAKPKNGGKKVAKLLQSFDEPESEVLMVISQQPVVVPGPTRYITRTVTQTMPVAVQIAPKSSGLRSLV